MNLLCHDCVYEDDPRPAEVIWEGQSLCKEHYIDRFEASVKEESEG